MNEFKKRGRLAPLMDHFKVYVVNRNLEVGLLGAREMARREMLKSI